MANKPNIILVDTNPIFRQFLFLFIASENIGKVIGVFSNGDEFIDHLSELHTDVVLMDIDMPNKNGISSTQNALELIPDLKIIACSIFSEEEYYYNLEEIGFKGFFLKSGNINQLEKAIQDVCLRKLYFSGQFQNK